MGRSAKLELFRRVLPLLVAVIGVVGAFTFLTPLSSLLCFAAALGIYAAMPRARVPKGAVGSNAAGRILISDFIGALIGVGCFSAGLLGVGGPPVAFLLFLMGTLSFFFFMSSVRLATAWARFLGNGFEICKMGKVGRLRYDELRAMRIRHLKVKGTLALLAAGLGLASRHDVSLASGNEESKLLIFVSKGGLEFAVASEMIPDLQRVLIAMDRAGVALPEGISERERRKIRRTRERLYRKTETEDATEPVDMDNVAETVRKYQQQKTQRDS